MRHEQATAYAADAYARVTGEPGVCCVTAGCGLTNAVTGLCGAALTNSSVVCLSGQHPTTEDYIGSFQEAYGSDVVSSFASSANVSWTGRRLRLTCARPSARQRIRPKAFPCWKSRPTSLYQTDDETKQRRGAKIYDTDAIRSQGDPRSIEKTAELLFSAQRPLIAGGDGIFWSNARKNSKSWPS